MSFQVIITEDVDLTAFKGSAGGLLQGAARHEGSNKEIYNIIQRGLYYHHKSEQWGTEGETCCGLDGMVRSGREYGGAAVVFGENQQLDHFNKIDPTQILQQLKLTLNVWNKLLKCNNLSLIITFKIVLKNRFMESMSTDSIEIPHLWNKEVSILIKKDLLKEDKNSKFKWNLMIDFNSGHIW